jgi:hypothetical protein
MLPIVFDHGRAAAEGHAEVSREPASASPLLPFATST